MKSISIWCEKYRPQTIEDCVLPSRIKDFFSQQFEKEELLNMLLIGGAGTGKTTIAKALCNQLGIDVLFINASENNGIDVIRNDIRSFASTVSLMNNKIKCVILDEADFLSSSSQPALRAFIEEFAHNCRFILTGNYANRIIDPIKSRCTVIDFSLNKDEKQKALLEFNKRAQDILKKENIEFNKKDLAEVIMKYFPDYRKTLNELQRLCQNSKLELTNSLSAVTDESIKQVMQYIKDKKFNEYRKWVAQNIDIDFSTLIKMLYNKMYEYIEGSSIPQFVLILAEYDYKRAFSSDIEILTTAMFTEIMGSVELK